MTSSTLMDEQLNVDGESLQNHKTVAYAGGVVEPGNMSVEWLYGDNGRDEFSADNATDSTNIETVNHGNDNIALNDFSVIGGDWTLINADDINMTVEQQVDAINLFFDGSDQAGVFSFSDDSYASYNGEDCIFYS